MNQLLNNNNEDILTDWMLSLPQQQQQDSDVLDIWKAAPPEEIDLSEIYVSRDLALIFLQRRIEDIIIGQVYAEFNDSDTRQKIVEELRPLMAIAKDNDVIGDWKIVCDKSNNNSQDILKGAFSLDVYIKKPGNDQYTQWNFAFVKTTVESATYAGFIDA